MEHIVDFVCFAPMVQILDAPRAVLRATQLAEQLVEVPTILSYASLQKESWLVSGLIWRLLGLWFLAGILGLPASRIWDLP